MLIELTGGWYF